MNTLLLNILGTVLGGLVLTFFLFLINEYCFPKSNLTGEWDVTLKIKKTSYKPFLNLTTKYKIHLLQKGFDLSGSGEKIKDINPDGSETVFLREKRITIVIEGYFERKYFRSSKVYLYTNEDGLKRETRATYFLTMYRNSILKGTFITTAADASGKLEMTKA